MTNSILTLIKRSRAVNYFRNYILLKPSIYIAPKSNEVSVSDFFFGIVKIHSKQNFILLI